MREFFDLGMVFLTAIVLALILMAIIEPPQKTATSSVLYRDGKIVP